jgi:hypothetical protein
MSKVLNIILSIVLLTLIFSGNNDIFAQSYEFKKLSDGVEHYWYPKKTDTLTSSMKIIENIFDIKFSNISRIPWGRSIAFLIGVDKYKHISPQLPSVNNDLNMMKDFLLTKGGFDEVYIARGGIVNRDVIEKYMKGIFPQKFKKEDRILFYYSGHGADGHGGTGYMQFGNAMPGEFYGPQVMQINTIHDWCKELPFNHMIFVVDCCASGLAFSSKSGTFGQNNQLIRTLSGNGSRVVLTAGTAEQETYAIEMRNRIGISVFTKAFLDTFQEDNELMKGNGFITITDIFAHIEKDVGRFASQNNKELTPRMWPLQEKDYRGTFIFINPNNKKLKIPKEYAETLNVKLGNSYLDSKKGNIKLYSIIGGTVYLDQKQIGSITHSTIQYYDDIVTGDHNIEVRSPTESINTKVKVYANETAVALISPEPNQTYTGGSSKLTANNGEIRIFTKEDQGKVYIDNIYYGNLNKNENILLKGLAEGNHELIILNKEKSAYREIEIKKDDTLLFTFEKGEINFIVKKPVGSTFSGGSMSGGSFQ